MDSNTQIIVDQTRDILTPEHLGWIDTARCDESMHLFYPDGEYGTSLKLCHSDGSECQLSEYNLQGLRRQ